MDKIKVVWVCSFSNPLVRSHYETRAPFLIRLIYKYVKNISLDARDSAVWNTNALTEFENYDDVDLHVICPVRFLTRKQVRCVINGIHYYFFREENSSFIRWIVFQMINQYKSKFKRNRNVIKRLVSEINPDVIHIIGAENPHYSLSAMDMPTQTPLIVQLQALLCRLVNTTQDPVEKKDFAYKGELEKQIILRADYIGTKAQVFIDYIRDNIKKDARFLDVTLATVEPINTNQDKKEYDFVYFSVGIKKAGIDAIEAFAIAHRQFPQLTMDIVGGYDDEYKSMLDRRLAELGITNCVKFEGLLPTHDDVIKQIRKSKYALLPLTMDLVPSTVREAMANGLPVVTSHTEGGTSELNKDALCVLLSPVGSFKEMADNMVKLVSSPELANEMCNNSQQFLKKAFGSNYEITRNWVEAYKHCLNRI